MFLRGKIKCSDFWVSTHDRGSDFYLCAWQRGASPLPQLLVRAALTAAAAGVLAWSLAGTGGGRGASPAWLIYLTNWGLVLVAAAALAGLFVSCMAAYDTPPEVGLPRGAPLYWLLFNVSQSAALAITVLYWTLVYNPESAVYPSAEAQARDIATHALNSVLTLAELMSARTPARVAHAWQPLLLAAGYVAFSALYHAAGGTGPSGSPFIYAVLDWRRPAAAGAAAGGALAGVLALHALVCALARARAAAARALLGPGPGPGPANKPEPLPIA